MLWIPALCLGGHKICPSFPVQMSVALRADPLSDFSFFPFPLGLSRCYAFLLLTQRPPTLRHLPKPKEVPPPSPSWQTLLISIFPPPPLFLLLFINWDAILSLCVWVFFLVSASFSDFRIFLCYTPPRPGSQEISSIVFFSLRDRKCVAPDGSCLFGLYCKERLFYLRPFSTSFSLPSGGSEREEILQRSVPSPQKEPDPACIAWGHVPSPPFSQLVVLSLLPVCALY